MNFRNIRSMVLKSSGMALIGSSMWLTACNSAPPPPADTSAPAQSSAPAQPNVVERVVERPEISVNIDQAHADEQRRRDEDQRRRDEEARRLQEQRDHH